MTYHHYSIHFVLGPQSHILVIRAKDSDTAYELARDWLLTQKYYSAALQGTCKVASQNDFDSAFATIGVES